MTLHEQFLRTFPKTETVLRALEAHSRTSPALMSKTWITELRAAFDEDKAALLADAPPHEDTETKEFETHVDTETGDVVCKHGTAMDVHCCHCHSGFVFDMAHECPDSITDAAEMLWVVLANVSGGDWTKQSADWQEAAARWRDNYFKVLRSRPAEAAPPSQSWQPIETLTADFQGQFVAWFPMIGADRGGADMMGGWAEYQELLGFGQHPATYWLPISKPPSVEALAPPQEP